jgi:hypothetical protein
LSARLEKHLQKILNDVVKMRGLITPASKDPHPEIRFRSDSDGQS